MTRSAALLGPALAALALSGAVAAAERPGGALLPGSSAKEPISIDAGRLDYSDREGKLVYSGDVVARQGASTLKGSSLTIFLSKAARSGKDAGSAEAGGGAMSPAAGSSIDRMEVKGPVTVLSRDEIGTGDSGSYDKAANTITLTGNVTLTQGANIIKGDRLVYDMGSGQARVSSGQTQGRVRSVFTPGSGASSVGKPGRPAAPPPAP